MYQALRSLGIDTQLVIYPNEIHGITRPSYVRDRYERYLAWYEKHINGKKPRGHHHRAGEVNVLVWEIVIGILAGFLAGKIMRGRGYGLLLDLLLGIVGSMLGGMVFGLLGLYSSGIDRSAGGRHRRRHPADLSSCKPPASDLRRRRRTRRHLRHPRGRELPRLERHPLQGGPLGQERRRESSSR